MSDLVTNVAVYNDGDKVNCTHPKYDKYLPKWKRVRDVLAGQDEIHEAGTTYLPKLTDQTTEQYKAYLRRAQFFNASWRTMSALLGMMFRKPPESDLPAGIDQYLKDISLRGVPFDVFSECFALEWLSIGFCGLLTDHPPALQPTAPNSAVTKAVAEQAGLRPVMQLYMAENIINWQHSIINNKHTLIQVVLKECNLVKVGEFKQKTEDRYRVLDIDDNGNYRQRVFIIDVRGNNKLVEGPITPLLNGQPLTEIPFQADFDFEAPPLIDLIDSNINHYLVSADYYHALHFTGLPTPVVTGYKPRVPKAGETAEKLYIGSETAWVFPEADAKAFYLEFTGGGLTELRTALDSIKDEMARLGARMLANEKASVEAFKTQAMRQAGENSLLSSIAIAVSLKLEAALKIFCQWAGSPKDDLKYQLNRDYMPLTMDAPTLVAIVGAWQGGAMSENEMFDLFKRGDLIESDKSFEEHQGEIDAAPPPSPIAPLAPDQKPGDPAPPVKPANEPPTPVAK